MSRQFATRATFVVLELVVLVAFTVWYISPVWLFGDAVRPVQVQARGDGWNWNFEEARIYNSLDDLQADYNQVEIDPPAVDFTREKLVRIDWQAAGYFTDDMWRNDCRDEPLFGEIRHDVSCGGKLVEFHFARPTQGTSLFGVKIHSVFESRVDTDWFAVPKPIAIHYRDANVSQLVFGLAFLASCILIVGTCLSRRQSKKDAKAAGQVDDANDKVGTASEKPSQNNPMDGAVPQPVSEAGETTECLRWQVAAGESSAAS